MKQSTVQNLRRQSILRKDNLISQTHIQEHESPNHQKGYRVFQIIFDKEFKGVISGDGIASNRLEFVRIFGKNQKIPEAIAWTKRQEVQHFKNAYSRLSLEGSTNTQIRKESYKNLLFDFTFFIIFNILFIQMIFGIILDKFSQPRNERQALVKKIEGKCFICSQDKNDIDTKGSKGWHYHIYLEHNAYHIILNLNDCNKFEKYV